MARTSIAGGAQTCAIVHHDIEAAIDPAENRIAVTDRITLDAAPNADRPLYLLLNRDLRVEVVELDGERLEVESGERFKPRHFWDKPDYERLDDYSVAREITVQPPAAGWPAEPELTLRYAGVVYDSLRAPKVAYSRGFETTSGLIDERGVYLHGGTFWIPWGGEGLIRFRLRVLVPPGWESVSQGTWAERRVTDEGGVESLWVVGDPMNQVYLIAGPYRVREAENGDVKAYTFTYEDTPEDLCNTYLDATGDYLRLYEDMIGPYPFDKFAMVENWWQTGFGMPSFTLLGNRVIRLPFIVHTSYGHEILHNWWGNGVFVDYDAGNWCEGLTTYLADYSYKAKESAAAARDYRLRQLQAYLDYASSGARDFALRKFTERASPSTQAVGYGKTMMVFHMARRLVGDDAFFEGLRRLYRDYCFEKASWDDVVASFEAATGRELEPWFEQWIGRPGAPVLTLVRDARSGGIEIRQEEPLYDLRVPVHFGLDGEVKSLTVPMDGEAVEVEMVEGAQWIAVDPDFELFRKLHRGEIPPALSQVLGADSTIVVIGSGCTPDMRDALHVLATEYGRNHDQVVVDEADFTGTNGRGVWLFGDGEIVDRIFDRTRAFGDVPARLRGEAKAGGRSLVAAFRDPERAEIPWTVVLPADATVVEALGRKLPHYGSYSYLVFEGETNVAKGSWAMKSSPLRLSLVEQKLPTEE